VGGGDHLGARHILRRLKTDKSVIADLPDKTEVKAATEGVSFLAGPAAC